MSALTLAAFGGFWHASPATAQSGAGLQPLAQPPEPTKAAFLARARALRDEAVREGDQAYGAVVARNGVIVPSLSRTPIGPDHGTLHRIGA